MGKTRLLTVYHELVSAGTSATDSRQTKLLGLLQRFEGQNRETLLADADQQPAAGNAVLAMVMQADHAVEQPNAPAVPIAQQLKQLREAGCSAAGLHSTARQVVDVLLAKATNTSISALNRFLAAVLDFMQAELLADRLLDKEQLACILHALQPAVTAGGAVAAASAARKAYLMQPGLWLAQQHNAAACLDELLLDDVAEGEVITPARAQSLLSRLAAVLAVGSLPTFQALQMHAQVTPAELWAKLRPLMRLAAACPHQQFTFFIDELNTSSMMGEMKSIFMDRSFQGVKLPANIFCVAAINPARSAASPQQADGAVSFRPHYAVRPCPPSMEEVVWAFGSLSGADERDYVAAKLLMVAAQQPGTMDFPEDTCRLLMRYVIAAQARDQPLHRHTCASLQKEIKSS